jgi:hypothetical protein
MSIQKLLGVLVIPQHCHSIIGTQAFYGWPHLVRSVLRHYLARDIAEGASILDQTTAGLADAV